MRLEVRSTFGIRRLARVGLLVHRRPPRAIGRGNQAGLSKVSPPCESNYLHRNVIQLGKRYQSKNGSDSSIPATMPRLAGMEDHAG